MSGGDDPATWTVEIAGADPELEAARSVQLTLADGVVGAPQPLAGDDRGGAVAAGIYDGGDGPDTSLVPLPAWNRPPFEAAAVRRRTLDLRDGTLRTELETPDGAATLLAFATLARPGTGVLVADAPAPALPAEGRTWDAVHGAGRVAIAGAERVVRQAAARARLERLVAHVTDPRGRVRPEAAAEALAAAERLGVERLLAEQRTAWARRWAAADVRIEGDPELQRAVRFCLFHLMASVADRPEAALGAKGLSGAGYHGHVFWDSDVFVLPFLAATHPPAARALVGYRARRLDAARAAATAPGSPVRASRGSRRAAGRTSRRAGCRTSTAAWSTCSRGSRRSTSPPTSPGRWRATRRGAAIAAPRRRRASSSPRRRATGPRASPSTPPAARHLDGVIGPDEYHEDVDDNAFTNAMARWNLEQAAGLALPGEAEATRWRELARALVDGYDERARRHEQFAGYFELEPLTVADLPAGQNPVDVLGWEHLQRTQLLKQADVLMLHLLVPELAGPTRWPTTSTGTSRARRTRRRSRRPVHAAVLARAGRLEQALDYLRYSATIDLENRGSRTAEGLHVATMGGVWHALVHGIAGLELDDGNLRLEPHLPPGWDALEFQVLVHDVPFRVRVQPDRVSVQAPGRRVRVGARWVELGTEGAVVEHDAAAWRAA